MLVSDSAWVLKESPPPKLQGLSPLSITWKRLLETGSDSGCGRRGIDGPAFRKAAAPCKAARGRWRNSSRSANPERPSLLARVVPGSPRSALGLSDLKSENLRGAPKGAFRGERSRERAALTLTTVPGHCFPTSAFRGVQLIFPVSNRTIPLADERISGSAALTVTTSDGQRLGRSAFRGAPSPILRITEGRPTLPRAAFREARLSGLKPDNLLGSPRGGAED